MDMDNELAAYLEKWRTGGEGIQLDLKESPILRSRKKIAKHMVAFANRNGGVLIIRADDEGEIEGASMNKEDSKDAISDAANDICGPSVSVTTQFLPKQNDGDCIGDVLIVDIPASSARPHAVVSGKNRAYYIRTTNQSRPILDAQGIQQLYLRNSTTVSDYIGDVVVNYDKGRWRRIVLIE